MTTKKAFTLTELLVALGIVGAIAVLVIPSLLNNINNRLLVSQLKNTVAIVQQLASEQLVNHKTQDLRETDFGSTGLLSGSNFEIAKTCADPAKDCWKTTAEDDKKITYRKISDKTDIDPAGASRASVVLKNGVLLSYATVDVNDYDGQKLIGEFCVDVNGNDSPNMFGRDYFCFYVTQRGKITSYTAGNPNLEQSITNCKNGSSANSCTKAIIGSNWNMTY